MIPLATTTISVLRVPPGDVYDEPYGTPAARTAVSTGTRAVIDRGRGAERVAGGEQSSLDLTLTADPVDLNHTDQVRDDTTNTIYQVTYVVTYWDSHLEAGLRVVTGLA